jgi:4-hydroxybenzoate polyprenyltransferase/phosphoserine phosphatase
MDDASSHSTMLAVDLDGTLVRTDLLYEAFWSAFARKWTVPLVALGLLRQGRPKLKHRLAELSRIDVAVLPYNEEVLAYVRRWRANGGRTALVTASHQELADKVAAHIGEFDQAYGSSGTANLKGIHKATFLAEKFGEGRFAYIGNSTADLPVWEKASKAITVSASPVLKARVSSVTHDVEHLPSPRAPPITYLRVLRPHQWLKNTLVFVPMLVAHQFNVEALTQSLLAFVSFCLVASSAYVFNDLLDLSADRAHPRKRYRPLASGALPIAHGTLLAPLILAAGLATALVAGNTFAAVMSAYFIATMAYSLHLKRRLIIDVCVLAGLYAMRVVAGGVATEIELSVWLLAFSIFFFFSLAAIKRQAELVDGIGSGQVAVRRRGYRPDDVLLMASMAAAAGYVAVLVMALYVNSPDVLKLHARPQALWGICLVLLYWISRMVMVTHRGRMHDDPIVYAAKDRISQICLLLILLFVAGASLP